VTKLQGGEEDKPLLTNPSPTALIDKIDQGFIGDSGYRGDPKKVSITRPGDSIEMKRFKAQVKSRHEAFNGRIKSFLVPAMPF
jgi:hypothetical protein